MVEHRPSVPRGQEESPASRTQCGSPGNRRTNSRHFRAAPKAPYRGAWQWLRPQGHGARPRLRERLRRRSRSRYCRRRGWCHPSPDDEAEGSGDPSCLSCCACLVARFVCVSVPCSLWYRVLVRFLVVCVGVVVAKRGVCVLWNSEALGE